MTAAFKLAKVARGSAMKAAIEERQAAAGTSVHSGDRILALTLSLLQTERQNLRMALGFRSLFLFSPRSRFRKGLFNLITNPWFDRAILVVILCNSLALGLFDPLCIGYNSDFDPASVCPRHANGYVCDVDTISGYSCSVFCAGWASIENEHACNSRVQHGMDVVDLICLVRHRTSCACRLLCDCCPHMPCSLIMPAGA